MVRLTGDQVQAVLATASGKPIGPLLSVALGTGCRMGELLGLNWKDVDLKHGRLTVRRALSQTASGFVLKAPKTKAGRRTITYRSSPRTH